MDIKKNQFFDVEILDNGFKGEGIAKIDNFTVFVPNVIKGEKVRIKILKVLSSHAFAKLEEVLVVSDCRKVDDCDVYLRCGGCAMRHIAYERTLEIKRESVISTLRKQGIDVPVRDVIGMENPLFYRNKLQYPLGKGPDGEPVMGVFAERTHRIVPTDRCFIQNERLQEVANGIFEFVKKNRIRVYDEERLSGEVRHLVLRIGVKTGEVMVVIVSNKRKLSKERELVRFISESFPFVRTIVKNVNPYDTNVILGNENVVLFGDGYICDELLECRFKISPMSFYQVNPYQTERLYSKAIEYAELSGNESVFDLYCGIGTIGICASKFAGKLYGIETVPEAIEDARENARLNGVENAEFFVGDVERVLPGLVENRGIGADVVFVDPPRKGCDRMAIETVLRVRPKRVVYISCNPATLARDLRFFEELYEVKEVTPVDMFPYTGHVECCSVLYLKN